MKGARCARRSDRVLVYGKFIFLLLSGMKNMLLTYCRHFKTFIHTKVVDHIRLPKNTIPTHESHTSRTLISSWRAIAFIHPTSTARYHTCGISNASWSRQKKTS
jgi:hypothetical protein